MRGTRGSSGEWSGLPPVSLRSKARPRQSDRQHLALGNVVPPLTRVHVPFLQDNEAKKAACLRLGGLDDDGARFACPPLLVLWKRADGCSPVTGYKEQGEKEGVRDVEVMVVESPVEKSKGRES